MDWTTVAQAVRAYVDAGSPDGKKQPIVSEEFTNTVSYAFVGTLALGAAFGSFKLVRRAK